jgi:ATP-dependent DNA ligase
VLDGAAVILGVDGVSDFNALHSRKHDHEVQFCAFDNLVEGSDDLRKPPLHLRKANLERLLALARGHLRRPLQARRPHVACRPTNQAADQ